ncbi:MAG: hypothetical protein J6T72_00025, partial [Alphaproteobacteria bacterium]|nr:hypothetical protein [Alphaproteobacteria bacterium]
KIFNKHIPPEGGNPGEDYNCRCWAEPYKPEKTAGKQQLVDLSGLDKIHMPALSAHSIITKTLVFSKKRLYSKTNKQLL